MPDRLIEQALRSEIEDLERRLAKARRELGEIGGVVGIPVGMAGASVADRTRSALRRLAAERNRKQNRITQLEAQLAQALEAMESAGKAFATASRILEPWDPSDEPPVHKLAVALSKEAVELHNAVKKIEEENGQNQT